MRALARRSKALVLVSTRPHLINHKAASNESSNQTQPAGAARWRHTQARPSPRKPHEEVVMSWFRCAPGRARRPQVPPARRRAWPTTAHEFRSRGLGAHAFVPPALPPTQARVAPGEWRRARGHEHTSEQDEAVHLGASLCPWRCPHTQIARWFKPLAGLPARRSVSRQQASSARTSASASTGRGAGTNDKLHTPVQSPARASAALSAP